MTAEERLWYGRAPCRISLAGGGSDLPAYLDKSGVGKVVSVAVSLHAHALLRLGPRIGGGDKVTAPMVGRFSEQMVPTPVYSWLHHEVAPEGTMHYHLSSDVPVGSGLGGSGAMNVTIAHTAFTAGCAPYNRDRLASTAMRLEAMWGAAVVGKQDQFAAAYGGVNQYTFWQSGRAEVERVAVPQSDDLERWLRLYYTGIPHHSDELLKKQDTRLGFGVSVKLVDAMVEMVPDAVWCLKTSNWQRLGEVVDEQWKRKRRLSDGVTSQRIDEVILLAKQAGAIGVKLTGAGGGGFLAVVAPPDAVTLDGLMESMGLTRWHWSVDWDGAQVAEVKLKQ